MDRQIKILIIDDEEIVLKSCLKILSGDSYDIDTALSAEKGLLKIRESKYDIVITDLKMPGMGGMELLKIIKK